MRAPRYCIIGAGAAGMAALKTLREEGFSVDCFEQCGRVGGHWHTQYDALHLITARNSSGFEDFPMPPDYPVYPSRDQVVDYLLAYADAFNLAQHIQFNTAVKHILPLGERGEAGWRVTLSSGDVIDYQGVLVANGHLWDPAIPDIATSFSGRSLHSCEYANVGDLEGRVLVVGCGNSGCDIAVDVAQARQDVSIVVRRGHLFQPKALFGRPRSELPILNDLPPEQQNMIMNLLIMASKGSASEYPGLPVPETYDLDAQPPIVNDLLLYWIQHGRIKVVPGLERIDGQTVHFTDGSHCDYDTVIWATGFNVRLPFLSSDLLDWDDGVPLRTAATVLPTTVESLYFVGLCAPRGPQWPVYCMQTRLIARMLRLHEAGIKDLAQRFRLTGKIERRIDIVRRLWLADLEESWGLLKFIAPEINNQVDSIEARS